jgi:hypothetical protein
MKKGSHHTTEAKEKNRLACLGRIPWNKGLLGYNLGEKNHFYGKKHTLETRQKMSLLKQGEKHNFFGKKRSNETKRKIGLANSVALRGIPQSLETRKKRAESHRGSRSHLWRGGVTPIQKHIRMIVQYDEWRKSVFKRDNYTCQNCFISGVFLNADHIKQFALILSENEITTINEAILCKELWDVSNGRTLCVPCHSITDTYRKKVVKLQLLPKTLLKI